MKKCLHCGEIKEDTDFYNPNKNCCKSCKKEYAIKYYWKNCQSPEYKERRREYDRKRRQSPEYKERYREYFREYFREYRQKLEFKEWYREFQKRKRQKIRNEKIEKYLEYRAHRNFLKILAEVQQAQGVKA